MATQLDHYRLLGNSGLRVSPLCLGTMTFGDEWGWGSKKEGCKEQLDLYADKGGNFIDTANFYTGGTSETILGELLQGRRDQFVLATKYTLAQLRQKDPNVGGNHRKSLHQNLDASLKRLKTDYIDLYWVHMYDGLTPIEETMRALDDAVRSGKILYVGVSDFTAWKIAQANTLAVLKGWTPFTALQVEYSLVERTVERDLLPMAVDLGLGVTPWSPLGAGVLTGKFLDKPAEKTSRLGQDDTMGFMTKYKSERATAAARAVVAVAKEVGHSPAQVALAWLMHQPGVVSPIIGGSKREQIEDNLRAVEVDLSAAQLKTLSDASAIELGFPHDFLTMDFVRQNFTAGTNISK